MNYHEMKKIELHLHLDGSVRLTTLAELAGLSLEQAQAQAVAPAKCMDLNDYLTRFALPLSIMQTKENLERIAYELAEDLKAENVIYAEIRFAPSQHTSVLSLEEVVEAVLTGLQKVDIKTNLLLSMMRNEREDVNFKIIDLAQKYRHQGVVGIDLAGAEALYPTYTFANLFAYANKLGVNFTIHAGEADGPSSIEAALSFGAKRLGHGVRLLEDNKLLNEVREKGILLEVCPTSNIQTNICSSISEHPIALLKKHNIKVCINTDNRTVSHVDLTAEYEKLAQCFNFTQEDFYNFNYNAIMGAFISDEEKEQLVNQLNN